LKKIKKLQKGKQRRDLEKLYVERQKVQDALEEKLNATECESGNMEVQRKNINKSVPDTMGDWIAKEERKSRKPWVTQEMINKVNERRQLENGNKEHGMKTN
jgi:hypothetical protein